MRVLKWDILKLFLIFTVVLGHIADVFSGESQASRMLFIWIYTFHMPAFFFIAGIFSKRTIQQRVWSRIFSYLTLYFASKILIVTSYYLVRGNYSYSIIKESGVPWFALALFFFIIIAIVAEKLDWRYVLAVSLILSIYVGGEGEYNTHFAISRIVTYFPFFYCGYLLKAESISERLDRLSIRLLSAVGLAAFSAFVYLKSEEIYWIRPLLTGQNPYRSLGDYAIWGPLLKIGYYGLAAAIIAMLISLTPNCRRYCVRIGSYLAQLGSRSMQVYLYHWIVQVLFIEVLHGFDLFQRISPAHPYSLVILYALLVTWLLSARFLEKPTELLTRIRYKDEIAART